MDAFESVVRLTLERQGYWVHSNYKVRLTKSEKRDIGKPSLPAVDLDLLAYRASENELYVVECKSFLDSPGVRSDSFLKEKDRDAIRYKLFLQEKYRETVFSRMEKQLIEVGRCRPEPTVRLCLATGNIASEGDRTELQDHFDRQGWILWDDRWVQDQLREFADASYENLVPVVVAKILTREKR